MILPLWVIILMLLGGIISAVGSLCLKKASEKLDFRFKSLFNKYLIVGFGLYFIASILGVIAYKGGELSIIYPVGASLSYIWVTLLSKFVLKEKINFYKVIGITFIIIGVIVMML